MYNRKMDVAISTLRSNLSDWLARAAAGEEVLVTDRGMPVARIVGLSSSSLLDELTEAGVLARPSAPRRRAAGAPRVKATASVADLVAEQRA